MSSNSQLLPTAPQVADPSWPDLVERVRSGDSDALEYLYRVFSTGIRFHLCRHLGPQDLDDKVHDIFVIVAESIRNGELREPERLMGYVRTVVRRQVAGYIQSVVRARRRYASMDFGIALSDHRLSPEGRAIERQNTQVAIRIMKGLREREREVLMRYYFQEQSMSEICQDMRLTETQFRLLKSRAKIRLGELGRNSLGRWRGPQQQGPQPSISRRAS